MSQRPRLAGDGTLTLPAKVAFDHHGFLHGRFSDRTVDPFELTDDRLLLAESFARLDLGDRGAVKAWWVRHGAVNAFQFTGGDAELPEPWEDFVERQPAKAFTESRAENAREQANVQWHLETLRRLSDNRSSTTWETKWGEFILEGPSGLRWVIGGPRAGAVLWGDSMLDTVERYPKLRQRYGDPEANAALRRSVTGWSTVTVRASAWYGYWDHEPVPSVYGPPNDDLDAGLASLGSTWDSAVELERLLLEPYVAQAVERRFRIDADPVERDGRKVLVPREERVWGSILAPVYLQLFEALRRITEGEPGAATCRECGRPFLVLDARRRFFCNDRERYRHAQRERRRRLATARDADPAIQAMTEAIDRELDESEAAERALRADLASPEPWLPPQTVKKLRRRRSR